MQKQWDIAIVGATGAVGSRFLQILDERNFPVKSLKLLASERSAGKKLVFKGKEYPVEVLTHDSFKGINLVLSSAGAARSKEFLPSAVKEGAICVDNTSAFRMQKDVPLIVPEVNAYAVHRHRGIIANPNCSTIQMVIALCPLHKAAKIKRIVVSTYQSVSGAGQKKVFELLRQSRSIVSDDAAFEVGKHSVTEGEIKEFPHQIAFNLIPHIDVFLDNAYTKEEMKMVDETRKIMADSSIAITATAVRVPVFYAHAESINIETEGKLTADKARQILSTSPGIVVMDDLGNNIYPLPVNDGEGKDAVYVGRIRKDESVRNGLNLWVVSDNLRKGAALNTVQIAELL
jgi:aspartate-semialdehyde dehydrogenase